MFSDRTFLPKDFIETSEGLFFAVVDEHPEDDRMLGTLRYVPDPGGRLRKLGTSEAYAYLQARHPDYLRYSQRLDALLPAVPLGRITRHIQPRERVRTLLARASRDPIEDKAARLLDLFASEGLNIAAFGLTGSLLIGAQNPGSDIDFVIYDRETFHAARTAVAKAMMAEGRISAPDESERREAYARRGCALSFEEYVWHERRKLNNGIIAGTKFDLTLVLPALPKPVQTAAKQGTFTLRAVVTDDHLAFDYPARYRIDHPRIGEVLSFTHTYVGQAQTGERIDASGLIEKLGDSTERLIVGTSREAHGEYIRVLRDEDE